jgi:hypothetical protein
MFDQNIQPNDPRSNDSIEDSKLFSPRPFSSLDEPILFDIFESFDETFFRILLFVLRLSL